MSRRSLTLLGAAAACGALVVGGAVSFAATSGSKPSTPTPVPAPKAIQPAATPASVRATARTARTAAVSAKKSRAKGGAARAASTSGPVVSSPSSGQSPDQVAGYWTQKRMNDAKPMSPTLAGGTAGPQSTSRIGSSQPGSTGGGKSPATGKQRAATSGQVASSPPGAESPDQVAAYWTQQRMNDAKPMGPKLAGGTAAPPSSPPSGSTLSGSGGNSSGP
jgi:hypothetical protein